MSNYPREILDNIIESDYLLFKEPAPSPSSTFLNPLFSTDLSNRKRILQDFIDEFRKKPKLSFALEDQDDPNDKPARPENTKALAKLRFKIDPLFRSQLKSHQVRKKK